MSNQNRIDALRRLADRPGTPHEGEVAREMLRRAEAKVGPESDMDFITRRLKILNWSATNAMDIAVREAAQNLAKEMDRARKYGYACECGTQYAYGSKCKNLDKHIAIQIHLRNTFPAGTKVYYNQWCYELNQEGIVTPQAWSKKKPEPWSWVRIKFLHLKSARSVPVWSEKGCHLSTEPIDEARGRELRGY